MEALGYLLTCTFAANKSAAAIDVAPSGYVAEIKLEGGFLMSTRSLIALCVFVFHGSSLLGLGGEAQAQNGAPVQNGSVFNSEGPGPNTGPSVEIQTNDNPPNGSTAGA